MITSRRVSRESSAVFPVPRVATPTVLSAPRPTSPSSSLARSWSAGSLLNSPRTAAHPDVYSQQWRERFGATTRCRAINVWERRAFGNEPSAPKNSLNAERTSLRCAQARAARCFLTCCTQPAPAPYVHPKFTPSLPCDGVRFSIERTFSPLLSLSLSLSVFLSSRSLFAVTNQMQSMRLCGSRAQAKMPMSLDSSHGHLHRVQSFTDLSDGCLEEAPRPPTPGGSPTPEWAPEFPWSSTNLRPASSQSNLRGRAAAQVLQAASISPLPKVAIGGPSGSASRRRPPSRVAGNLPPTCSLHGIDARPPSSHSTRATRMRRERSATLGIGSDGEQG